MRIAQVNTSDQGGGAESVVRTLHHSYRARGHEATLYVGRRRSAADGVLALQNGGGLWRVADSLRDAGHPRLARVAGALASPQTAVNALRGREDFVFPGTRAILEAAASLDILQLHNLHGSYFDLRMLPALSARTNVVMCPHDQWPVTGHVAYSFDCERWRVGCGSCPHLRVYPALLVDGTARNWLAKAEIYRGSSVRVGVPSKWLADVVSDSMLAPAVRELRVIPNGIDLDVFRPGDRAAARDVMAPRIGAKVIVFTGHGAAPTLFKDTDTLLRVLERLGASEGDEVDAVVLGGAPAESRTMGRVVVRFPGSLEPRMVATWLRAADAYLHVVRAETQGLAILEALACGVPVIATAVGGVPEQLTPATGELVAVGDVDALVTATKRLLEDDPRRMEMGEAAAAHAFQRFGVTRQIDAYLSWFEEIACC